MTIPERSTSLQRTVTHDPHLGCRRAARRHRKPLSGVGGKTNSVDEILRRYRPHRIHVEVFANTATVTLAKEPSRREVLNDLDPDVANVYRVIRSDGGRLAERIGRTPSGADIFARLLADQAGERDAFERAFGTIYIRANSYCGGYRKRPSFAGEHTQWHPARLAEAVLHWQKRLAPVLVEQEDFSVVIAREDAADTLYYCDPPYPGQERLYRTTFRREDHARLAGQLQRIRGRAVVSMPDARVTHELYGWASRIVPLPVRYCAGRGRQTMGREALVLVNYSKRDLEGVAV